MLPNEYARRSRTTEFTDLYLLDTDKDQVQLVRTESAIWDVCVDGDWVVLSYTKGRDRDAIWIARGHFPSLDSELVDAEAYRRLFRRPDCKPVQDDPRLSASTEVNWLRTEDGFVVRAGGGLKLYRPDGTVMPIDAGNEVWSLRTYASFNRSYLFLGGSRNRQSVELKPISRAKLGDEIVLFWLEPNGKTVPVEVPFGLWHDASGGRYKASRAGLVLNGGFSDSERDAGYQGLYLFDQSGPTRQLAAGPSHMASVSPDGCRIAFAHAPFRSAPMTMKIIDVCRGP